MTPHQTARWNNAVAISNRINALLDEGYLVFDKHQQPAQRFTITDTMIQSGSIEKVTRQFEDHFRESLGGFCCGYCSVG
jgi:hypothetical protein